jgi:hypothetical protein
VKNSRKIINLIAVIISLIASVLALTTAIISLNLARLNAKEVELQKNEIKDLKKVVAAAALSLTIEAPREGEVISTDVYNDMHGVFEGDIPEGYQLWVLARDQYNYFLIFPPTQFTRTMQKWSQTSVRLATPGRWELHVCLADQKASEFLRDKAEGNDWSGFSTLPKGMETISYVIVKRK